MNVFFSELKLEFPDGCDPPEADAISKLSEKSSDPNTPVQFKRGVGGNIEITASTLNKNCTPSPSKYNKPVVCSYSTSVSVNQELKNHPDLRGVSKTAPPMFTIKAVTIEEPSSIPGMVTT